MQIPIADPLLHTHLFIVLLIAALIISLRRRADAGVFSNDVTQELKGFAILAIVFAHIGYYLVTDNRFLFPLSTIAGVGVDIFLFVSGFGLAISALRRPLTPIQFYLRRLKKLYIPLWLTLGIFFLMDFVILHKAYGLGYIARSFVGWFPSADIYADVNSPLWYISLILFYYALFPFIFSRRWPALSAVGLFCITYAIVEWSPAVLSSVMRLYQLHTMAFPLGIIVAATLTTYRSIPPLKNYMYYPMMTGLLLAVGYLALHSYIGQNFWLAQSMSVLTATCVVLLFLIKRFEFRLLYLVGIFSFEVYLLHWPILYRYDVFFRILPASIALVSYIALFVGLGWVLQYLTRIISPRE